MSGAQQTRARPWGSKVASVVIGVVAMSSLVSGCQVHHVAASDPCSTVAGTRKIVAVQKRGAVAVGKIGLTPKVLEAEEHCK
jgi:hypothetical protein